MIRTNKELEFYIKADYMMNRGYFKPSILTHFRSLIFPDYIMDYIVHMRKADYYAHRCGVLGYYHRMKQRKLGLYLVEPAKPLFRDRRENWMLADILISFSR